MFRFFKIRAGSGQLSQWIKRVVEIPSDVYGFTERVGRGRQGRVRSQSFLEQRRRLAMSCA